MGLFSSKKKTYVATEVTRLYKDKDIPDMHQKNVIDSVFNNEPMTKTIINNALDSQTLKLERAYRRAARGDYYYGAPNHNIYHAADGKTVLQNILEIQHESNVRLDYFHFAPLNNLHYAWQVLTWDYGYDEFSNSLVLDGVTHWVKDIVGQVNTVAITSDSTAETEQELVPDDGTLEVWGRHPQDRYMPNRPAGEKTPVWFFDAEIPDGALVYLVARDGTESTVFIGTESFDRDMECFQAKYTYTDDAGNQRIGYFTYEHRHGEYPELDAVHEKTAVGKGTFFPVLIFRSGDRNLTASKYHDTEAYKSSVRLADSIGLDYQYIGDNIDSGESADDLQQAVLMMGVPAKTSDPVEAEYLFRFFDWLYKESSATTEITSLDALKTSRPGQSIRIKERDFDCTLSFSRIRREHKTGSIGNVGTYTCREVQTEKFLYQWRRTEKTQEDGTVSMVNLPVAIPYTVPALEYRYQVTGSSYHVLTVENLKLRYNIYGSKGVDANVGNSKLLVPLDYYISRSMRYDRKDRLYYRSLHFVFNSRVTKTVKWYESGIFQVILMIIVVVITIWSGGAGGALAGAISAGAYGAAAIIILSAIIQSVMTSLFMNLVFKVVIEELGAEIGAVIAVVAFVAAVYGANVGADWSSAALQASNNLANTSMSEYQQEKMTQYNEERQEFELLKDARLAELEEAENLLQQYALLDPRSFIAKEPQLIPGESPDSLYQRTVHVGNPGILQYDYIESYVELNTQLPTFNDLVGETFV